MANRLKEMSEKGSWHLMVRAALEGAKLNGYELAKIKTGGRGPSNVYLLSKNGTDSVTSVRTTRDRWLAFPPLDGGARWKTLSDSELVLVSTVDDKDNPQNVSVYLFPADEVRKRFDASYAARKAAGHNVKDNWGMWVALDKGDDNVPSQVGHSLAIDYPAIHTFSLDELESDVDNQTEQLAQQIEPEPEEVLVPVVATSSTLNTVADVLAFAREKIASLTGMPVDAIKLDLKMGV